jgi:hypothetical protein
MTSVLSKVRKLEEYISLTNASSLDRVLGLTIDKLIAREISRLTSQKAKLEGQLVDFERKYSLNSKEFYEKFERGELGDAMDFVEWSATYEMVKNLERQLATLGEKGDNVKHYMDLPNAPHHLHTGEPPPQPVFDVPNALTVLGRIEEEKGNPSGN